MFDLEQAVADWRRQMLAAGIQTPVPLEELEIHLRDEIERQVKSGMRQQKAFELATRQIGQAGVLKKEFKKVRAERWNHSLAIAAWAAFVISFFLPSYHIPDFMTLPGYMCALVQDAVWTQAMRGDWTSIHLELLTLANLLMLTSPFWLFWASRASLSLKWFRYASLAAFLLVWSFGLLLLLQEGGHNLKVGSYVWAVSFLLLLLSTFQLRSEKAQYV
jgi:hypothetical protein